MGLVEELQAVFGSNMDFIGLKIKMEKRFYAPKT